jgi:sugar/nucleoside kinase (ribokinase family)
MIDYLLIGHVTADVHPHGRTLGGTVSYSAPLAHALGKKVGILTSCSVDETLIAPLLNVAEVHNRVAPQTTTFENVYSPLGRHQTVHAFARPLRLADVPQGFAGASLVHLAPLVDECESQLAEHFPQAVVMLTAQGLLRQWDSQGVVTPKAWLDERVLGSVQIMVLSKQDIAGYPELEAQYAERVAHLFITDGAQGGLYYRHGQAQAYSAYPADEVDATGAGDVFATALLASLPHVEQRPHADELDVMLEQVLPIAIRLAALAVTRRGVAYFSPQEIAWARS